MFIYLQTVYVCVYAPVHESVCVCCLVTGSGTLIEDWEEENLKAHKVEKNNIGIIC